MICFLNTKGQCPTDELPDLINNFNAVPLNIGYVGKFRNMKVFINQNGGYNIKGSVWKYQLGNNITPLELPAYEEAIKDLNSLTFGTYM